MRFDLELTPAAEGRVEGYVGSVAGDQRAFSGWLELLRILEADVASWERDRTQSAP